MSQYQKMADEALIHTYNRYPVTFMDGEGVYLFDADGKKYLDFGAGIAVMALGYHYHPFDNALKKQVDQLIHTSNLFYNVPLGKAAQNVKKATGMDRIFFTNSGTEANEGAIKLARKYKFLQNPEKGTEIISMEHSFHGRSLGSLSVTGQKKYQEAYRPFLGEAVKFATYNDLDSVKALVNEQTCAIIMEPVQGEGGIYPATQEFIEGVRKICDEKDIVLIFDEIQCGMGRTGSMYAYEQYGVKPDILTTAKALGCGIPVGAFAATQKIADAFVPGDHGTTYGGNPLAMSAVNAVFEAYDELGMLSRVQKIAPYLQEKLKAIAEKYSFVKEVRGKGLMLGMELTMPVGPVVAQCLDNGLVLISAGANTIRFVPPLVIQETHVDEMIQKLEVVFSQING